MTNVPNIAVFMLLCFTPTITSAMNVDVKFPRLFGSKQPRSHFGFTVTFHRSNGTNRMWAMVGAPKANSTVMAFGVIEPGAVFKCDLQFLDCEEVAFDRTGNGIVRNEGNSNFMYKDLKNNMFLGGSMNSGHGDFMACAHLWKNAIHSKLYLSNGLCYIINENLEPISTHRIIPLLDRRQQASQRTYKYAFGMAGMSSTFTDTGMLLGAPGISNYIGSNIFYEVDSPGEPYKITNPKVADYVNSVDINSYFGYSVDSGRFYGSDLYFVAGAPKEHEVGRVYIYEALDFNVDSIQVKESKRGQQLGEYFGSSICVVNLNNDGYDDLLVGSPFFTTKDIGDHGRVYSYISDGKVLKKQDVNLVGLLKKSARFGSALSAIGDLNQDGFNDVVIGAPYEDGVGAVYIYHGSQYGISPSFEQRISASDIDRSLKGFGISIARGDDMDGNKYNDLLIGSYESDQAVLLRTHPVVTVRAFITFDVPFLDLNFTKCSYSGQSQPCFKAKICLSYSGKHVPSELDFDLLLEMETLRKGSKDSRGYMLHEGIKVTRVKFVKTIKHKEDTCQDFETHIYKSTRDLLTPVQFRLTYNLKDASDSQFVPQQPVMDMKLGNTVTNQILLQTNCGLDSLCSADLTLSIGIMNLKDDEDSLIIGQKKDVTVAVKIKNVNETAIHSIVHLEFQKDVDFKNLGDCEIPSEQAGGAFIVPGGSGNTNKVITCKAIPLLERGAEENFFIKLGILRLKPKSNLVVIGTVKTRSHETNLKNNKAIFRLPVVALADVTIQGRTKTPQIVYEGDKTNKKDLAIASHSYEIIKLGASPIKRVKVTLAFPYLTVDQVSLIKFSSIDVDDDSSSVSGVCETKNLPIAKKRVIDDGTDPEIFGKGSKSAKLSSENEIAEQKLEGKGREKREVTEVKNNKKNPKNVQRSGTILNCTNAKCIAIECYFGPFTDNSKTGKIKVTFEVNITSVFGIPFLKYGDTVMVQTSGSVIIKDRHISFPSPIAPKTDDVITTLLSTKSPQRKPIALWIIIVSIIAGIVVLFIILVILVKVGFFKRKVKEDMEKLKAKAEIAEWEKLVDQPERAAV